MEFHFNITVAHNLNVWIFFPHNAYICLCQSNLFKCLVRSYGKSVLSIRRSSHTIVTAGLEHTVTCAFPRVRIPLIYCTIHTTRDNLTVVREPGNGLDPSTMTFEIWHTLKSCCWENLNNIACYSCKEMSSIAEGTLKWKKEIDTL